MIGGLFVGLADGIAPGIGVVGFDVFVLGEVQCLHEGLAEIQRRKADPSLPSGAREQQPTSEGGRYMTTGARGLALAGPKTRHWDAPFASLRLGRAKARP